MGKKLISKSNYMGIGNLNRSIEEGNWLVYLYYNFSLFHLGIVTKADLI